MAMQTSDEALEKCPEREKKQRVLAIDREPSKVGMESFRRMNGLSEVVWQKGGRGDPKRG